MIIKKQYLPSNWISYAIISEEKGSEFLGNSVRCQKDTAWYLVLQLENDDFIRFKLLPPEVLFLGDESSYLDILVVTGFTESNIQYIFDHTASDYSVTSFVGADHIYVTHPRCSAGVFLTFPSFPKEKL